MNSKTVIPEHLHWQESLNTFWYGFLSRCFTPNSDGIDPIPQLEPKDTMLSFPIAQRREEGGDYLYSYEAGMYGESVPFTLETVKMKFDEYFSIQQTTIKERIRELEEKVIHKELLIEIQSGADGIRDTVDDMPRKLLERLEQQIEEVDKEVLKLILAEYDKFQSLCQFKENIDISFNPTAGYIDIGYKGYNKYRPMIEEFMAMGYSSDEILFALIGDSSTDIITREQTGKGEPNEGADEVLSIAVHNCSPEMRREVELRGTYGVITARDSVLGLLDTMLGFRKLLEAHIYDQNLKVQ
jgi:hypothetical protein